jgi:hypothetical protein
MGCNPDPDHGNGSYEDLEEGADEGTNYETENKEMWDEDAPPCSDVMDRPPSSADQDSGEAGPAKKLTFKDADVAEDADEDEDKTFKDKKKKDKKTKSWGSMFSSNKPKITSEQLDAPFLIATNEGSGSEGRVTSGHQRYPTLEADIGSEVGVASMAPSDVRALEGAIEDRKKQGPRQ